MDFDPESGKKQQKEPIGERFFDARPPIFNHPYPCNFGVAVPGFFVPFPSYSMCPNAAVEQQVLRGSRNKFPRGVCEDWTGNESRRTASCQIQNLEFSANSELDFNSASQVETRALYATPRQQDWPYETATHYSSSNELNLPQANAVAHTSSDTYSHDPTSKQQDWYGESAARANIPNSFELAWQDHTAHNSFTNVFDQNSSTNLLHSNGTSEINLFSDNSIDTQPNYVSSSIESDFSSLSFQASTSTYCTSSPLQEGPIYATTPSYIPDISFSSTSTFTTSPPTSPINAPSPNSTRHPCLHPHCQSTFSRQGDLKRHAKIHFPERHRKYHCGESGCDRYWKGFTRRDKLRDHVRRAHRVEEDGGES